jgi:hypothetical protein
MKAGQLIGFLRYRTNKCLFNFLFKRIEAYLPRFFIGYWILNEAGFLSGFLFFRNKGESAALRNYKYEDE